MTIALPVEKQGRLKKLIQNFQNKRFCKIREFAQLLGSLTSVCPAILYGWVYTKKC